MQDVLTTLYPRIIQPVFDQVFTFRNLLEAAFRCAQGVQWKRSVQEYMLRRWSNSALLAEMLREKTFRSPGFCHFVIDERGKIRDINSVKIEERVVQKVLCELALRPCIVPRLIVTNCASLPGRGTNAALTYFRQSLIAAHRKHGNNCNVLITDYHGYYDSIDHVTLLNLFYNWIEDKDIFDLFAYFVSTFVNLNQGSKTIKTLNSIDPANSPSPGKKTGIYRFEDLEDFDWYNDNNYFDHNTTLDVGLGLGSEISQLAAIAYVNAIDHAIKEVYRIEYYARYMDDSFLIDSDSVKLKECYAFMVEESKKYNLTYNPKHTNMYKITDHYTFLKKRTFVDKKSGAVVMHLLPESITKHRHTFKNQKHLLENGKLNIFEIFENFYSWRRSVEYLNDRNTLIHLTKEFVQTYAEYLDLIPDWRSRLYKL